MEFFSRFKIGRDLLKISEFWENIFKHNSIELKERYLLMPYIGDIKIYGQNATRKFNRISILMQFLKLFFFFWDDYYKKL